METIADKSCNRENLVKDSIDAAYRIKLDELNIKSLRIKTAIKQHIQNIIDYKNNLIEKLNINDEFLDIYHHRCELHDNQVYKEMLVNAYQELTNLKVI